VNFGSVRYEELNTSTFIEDSKLYVLGGKEKRQKAMRLVQNAAKDSRHQAARSPVPIKYLTMGH
jgi:hypothetical protein